MSGSKATKWNAVVNLSLDLGSLNAAHVPASAAASMRAFRAGADMRVISTTERAFISVAPKYDSTQLVIMTNVALEGATVYGATQ